MHYSTWSYFYQSDIRIPTNTYRIRLDWTDRAVNNVHMSDITATTSTNVSKSLQQPAGPEPGYFIGGLNPDMPNVGWNRCFNGDIAEFICFRGSLNDSDRDAVVKYLRQKYILQDAPSYLSYQWQRNQRDMLDATNSILSIRSATTNDSGVYSVLIKTPAGTVYSKEAQLTVTQTH
jgi:hypothetical protein